MNPGEKGCPRAKEGPVLPQHPTLREAHRPPRLGAGLHGTRRANPSDPDNASVVQPSTL